MLHGPGAAGVRSVSVLAWQENSRSGTFDWISALPNEVFCTGLANAVGLNPAETAAHQVDDVAFHLSWRYERAVDRNGTIHWQRGMALAAPGSSRRSGWAKCMEAADLGGAQMLATWLLMYSLFF
jgi:hypothetical protein